MYSLLNIDRNAKTVKGQKRGYTTAILYLASGDTSGYEVCPGRTAACSAHCLYKAGRGIFQNVQDTRVRKTRLFFEKRDVFLRLLENEIYLFLNDAEALGLTPCVRLNGTSDISWEDMGIIETFPDVQFYDYTKVLERMFKPRTANYNLVFSRSDENESDCRLVLEAGMNVAVVFGDVVPQSFWNYPVINGDQDDLRFLDECPVIVGLSAKGPARKETSGFVVRELELEGVAR